MGQVNVQISGRSYRIACEDGQEDHLQGLAGNVESSINDLRHSFGEIGDQRLIVMAAITLADRVAELERQLDKVQSDIAAIEEARAAIVEREAAAEAELVRVIDQVTARIEGLANNFAQSPEPERS